MLVGLLDQRNGWQNIDLPKGNVFVTTFYYFELILNSFIQAT